MPLRPKKISRIIFIVGPTASGKSKVALYLAKKINAEIISCDSMQIYKGMGILSSKPSAQDRKKIKHHLISVVSPEKEYNTARFRKEALKNIKAILKRGKIPLFAGGAGLYTTILLDGIFKAGSADKKIRQRLFAAAEKFGSRALHERLSRVDPEAARKIHPHDTKRIVRALEVYESTGKPISELQKQRKGLWQDFQVEVFCLNMQRKILYERIDQRVETMFSEGIIPEVKKLLKLKLSKTSHFAIGIRELKDYFDGKSTLDEAKELIKKNTRAYAKRQLTWFRKDRRIKWINIKANEKPRDIANRILKRWKKLY